jgi:WXG100 family type VII secretion target
MQPIRLTVDSQVLNDQARDVTDAASDIDGRLKSVTAQVNALQANWQGAASDKFQSLWQEWQTGATQLLEAMTGIGDFLRQAATAYEETEANIASNSGR